MNPKMDNILDIEKAMKILHIYSSSWLNTSD